MKLAALVAACYATTTLAHPMMRNPIETKVEIFYASTLTLITTLPYPEYGTTATVTFESGINPTSTSS